MSAERSKASDEKKRGNGLIRADGCIDICVCLSVCHCMCMSICVSVCMPQENCLLWDGGALRMDSSEARGGAVHH